MPSSGHVLAIKAGDLWLHRSAFDLKNIKSLTVRGFNVLRFTVTVFPSASEKLDSDFALAAEFLDIYRMAYFSYHHELLLFYLMQ
jgi:hypothetical protein